MIEKMRKICGLICLAAIIWMIPVSVRAAEKRSDGCTVMLPVYVNLEGADTAEEFEFVLEPDGAGIPMPESDTIRISAKNGIGEGKFPGIRYRIPGEYRYYVSQTVGDAGKIKYDSSTYEVMVRVVNDEDGGLTSEIWAVRENAKVKSDRISFTNKAVPTQTAKPTATPTVTVRPSVSKTVVSHSVKTAQSPKTGDNTPLEIFVGILVLAGVTASVIFILRKKHRNS